MSLSSWDCAVQTHSGITMILRPKIDYVIDQILHHTWNGDGIALVIWIVLVEVIFQPLQVLEHIPTEFDDDEDTESFVVSLPGGDEMNSFFD
jgi:hypothetical protein